jgi:hypothetical protein
MDWILFPLYMYSILETSVTEEVKAVAPRRKWIGICMFLSEIWGSHSEEYEDGIVWNAAPCMLHDATSQMTAIFTHVLFFFLF